MTGDDRLHAALGVTHLDLPITDEPLHLWSVAQLDRASGLVRRCRETFGVEQARKLMRRLGLPMPPSELVDPLPGEQRRH